MPDKKTSAVREEKKEVPITKDVSLVCHQQGKSFILYLVDRCNKEILSKNAAII